MRGKECVVLGQTSVGVFLVIPDPFDWEKKHLSNFSAGRFANFAIGSIAPVLFHLFMSSLQQLLAKTVLDHLLPCLGKRRLGPGGM